MQRLLFAACTLVVLALPAKADMFDQIKGDWVGFSDHFGRCWVRTIPQIFADSALVSLGCGEDHTNMRLNIGLNLAIDAEGSMEGYFADILSDVAGPASGFAHNDFLEVGFQVVKEVDLVTIGLIGKTLVVTLRYKNNPRRTITYTRSKE